MTLFNSISKTQHTNAISTAGPTFFQPKLAINKADDQYEKEADVMADKVMKMEKPFVQAKPMPITALQRKCAHCEEEEKKTQRKEMNSNETTTDHSLENYVGDLIGKGQSLPGDVRNFYEPRFGYDFSNVKVHTDSVAAKSAQSINALAYTSGNNIVFNSGQYSPGTDNGKRLLGHELTHVVQQKSYSGESIQKADDKKVTLSHNANCTNPRAIAEAVPGAYAMADTAFSWFLSFNSKDVKRVNYLLKMIFLSDSEAVHTTVKNKVLSIKEIMGKVKTGNISFNCPPATDTNCKDLIGFVKEDDKSTIHLCPVFFTKNLEERRWNLIHESAHIAGVSIDKEAYHADFGTVQCASTPLTSTVSDALKMADNYAKFIWCLVRSSSVVIREP